MPVTARLTTWRVTTIAGGILVALVAGLYVFASREIANARAHALSDLDNLAGIKALQISDWYRERLDDSSGRGQDPLFVGTVREWVAGRRSPELAQRIQGSITPKRLPWRYLNVWLLSLDGQTLFRAKPGPPVDPSLDPALMDGCRREHAPIVGAMRRDGPVPSLDMCVAVVEPDRPDAQPTGIYVYGIDASQLLIPTVEFSTPPLETATTTVVAPENGSVRTIVSSSNASQALLPPETLAAWIQAEGQGQTVSATDSDGRLVIGAVRRIANTPWHLVVSIPRAEADGPAIAEVREISVYGLALILGAALVVYEWLRRTNVRNAADLMRFDRLLLVRSAINEAIVRIHDRGPMLQRFCEIAVSLGRFDFAAVFELARPGIGRLAASHGSVPERLRDVEEFPIDDALRRGPLGPVLSEGRVVIMPDLTQAEPHPWTTSLVSDGQRAFVAIPIREGNQVRGFFALYSIHAGAFDRRDAQLFDELAADISYALENVAADQHRRVVEAQLHAISDAAPFAMFLIDRADQTIRMANRAALKQYGYAQTELLGSLATTIFTGDELSSSTAMGDNAALPATATHRHKDGRNIQVEVALREITVDGRQAVVAVAVDVTDRQQLEQQVRQAQRLEAVGRLAGGVAHDFNNLLTVMGGFAALMLRELPEGSPNSESAATIKAAADRAAALTGQLLAFSRKQTLQVRQVHLNAIVRETGVMLSRLIGEDIHLDLAMAASRDVVTVDPAQMQQVIMNLAVNARDAMPTGGLLRIVTDDFDDGSPQGQVELRVSDTGSGIPPDALDHIFEPFFTTKSVGVGTGLGLSTVHGIVTQSGGTIGLDTAVGRGTTFWMRFPRAKPDAAEPPRPTSVPRSPGAGTILLVEDDPGVRAFAHRVLASGGYTVMPCLHGEDAVEQHLNAEPGSIDLLLTDIVMPRMSGPEVAERFKAHHPHLAVLFMSGYADDAASRLGLNLQEMDMMKKPFDPEALLERVASILQTRSRL